MTLSRRSLLGALAALPVVRALVPKRMPATPLVSGHDVPQRFHGTPTQPLVQFLPRDVTIGADVVGVDGTLGMREWIEFRLNPDALGVIEPRDVVRVSMGDRWINLRIDSIARRPSGALSVRGQVVSC